MNTASLHLYTADTPNGQKIPIALEELGLDYTLTHVDLNKGEQKAPDFLALNPNGKIPVLTDRAKGVTLFESAVILTYLADQNASLGGQSEAEKLRVQQWLSFQIASVGPMLGQLWWFRHASSVANEQALDRYRKESLRLYGVVNSQLADREYIAGDSYTIADIALFTWLRTYEELDLDMSSFPAVRSWLQTIEQRPAVERGLAKSRQEA
jgi:GST-like protein